MKISIQSIKFDATEKLEQFIEKKLAKLELLSDEIQSVEVYLKVVKPETSNNKEAEIVVFVPNSKIFASKICDTFEEAVVSSIEAVEKQMKKMKDKN
ncbi:MAG: ribosome-associated translation inhibitor RaiA [bacterium]